MSGETEFLKHSYYPREGYKLDVGRLWEISTGADTIRDLGVFADARGIRIRDMHCGEWEMAERSAVHLTPDQARALGEILLEAADIIESRSGMWRTHARQADPRPALAEALDEYLKQSEESRKESADEVFLCPDCIADGASIADYCTCDRRKVNAPPCPLHTPQQYPR